MHSNIVGYTPKIESRIRPREIASNVTRYLAVDKDTIQSYVKVYGIRLCVGLLGNFVFRL